MRDSKLPGIYKLKTFYEKDKTNLIDFEDVDLKLEDFIPTRPKNTGT